jgi:O-antigen ligase
VPALLAAIVLWSLASAAWSVLPSASFLDAQRTLLYLTAAIAFGFAGDGLVVGVLGGGSIVAAWAIAGRLIHGAPVDPFEGRLLTGPIGYANGLAALAAIGIAVSIAFVARRRLLAAVPLVVLVPALLLTNSRGALVACLVGVVVAAAVATGRRTAAAVVVAGASLALMALLVFTPASLGDRAAYWGAARHMVAAHPLGGTGAGTFHVDYTSLPPGHDAHSLYLQAFAELGVVGLVLIVALVALPLGLAIRRGLAAPAAGLAVFALAAGVDWDWQLPAVTVAALALAAATSAKPAPLELR